MQLQLKLNGVILAVLGGLWVSIIDQYCTQLLLSCLTEHI